MTEKSPLEEIKKIKKGVKSMEKMVEEWKEILGSDKDPLYDMVKQYEATTERLNAIIKEFDDLVNKKLHGDD